MADSTSGRFLGALKSGHASVRALTRKTGSLSQMGLAASVTSGQGGQFRIRSEPVARSLGKSSLLSKLRSTEDGWELFMEGEKSTENQLK